MPSLTFLVPGRLDARTGGYEYDRQMLDGLRGLGWQVSVRQLDRTFPQPDPAALIDADGALATVPDGETVLIDGLALGAMPDAAARVAGRVHLVALVHHPLADETGIDVELSQRLFESERRALEVVDTIVVTSARTADRLASRYGVAAARIAVIEPGTAPAPLARGSFDGTTRLLCVASFTPRKGHAVLVRALADLASEGGPGWSGPGAVAIPSTPWTLTCVGGMEERGSTVAALRALIAEHSLDDRVLLHGEAAADTVAAHYDRSDVFVLPTLYEGYGMVVAEALARGLPVMSTPTGAIAELVGADAGMLVAAGDVAGWTSALRHMLDPAVRARYAAAARARRGRLPTWAAQATRLSDLIARGRPRG